MRGQFDWSKLDKSRRRRRRRRRAPKVGFMEVSLWLLCTACLYFLCHALSVVHYASIMNEVARLHR